MILFLDLTLHVLSDHLVDQGRSEWSLNSKIKGLFTILDVIWQVTIN